MPQTVPPKPKTPEATTKVTRLINGALIIGKTTQNFEKITITKPYTIIPGQQGLEMYPFDADILGHELEEMELSKEQTMYSEAPGKELTNTYIEAISGIQAEKKQEIIF